MCCRCCFSSTSRSGMSRRGGWKGVTREGAPCPCIIYQRGGEAGIEGSRCVSVACSLTRALLPGLMNVTFGDYTYHVLGIVETVKGILAFVVRCWGGADNTLKSRDTIY